MKKGLLFAALIATALVAHATVYNFGSTSGSITTNQITVANFTAATAVDSMLVAYDYIAAPVTVPVTPPYLGTASISSIPNFQLSYSNTSNKTSLLRIYPYALYTSGKGVILTINNVTIGDSLIIATQSKGTTADIWTLTGANSSSNLTIVAAPASPAINPVSHLRLIATDVNVILKETAGGFRLLSINWFHNTGTSLNKILSDKGVSFNGTQIMNTKGLSLEVYSVLGKRVASSTASISTTNFQKGVYIVRVSGSNDSLKICI